MEVEEILKKLRSWEYVNAFIGNLEDLKQGSYIPMFEVTKFIGELEQLKKLQKLQPPIFN